MLRPLALLVLLAGACNRAPRPPDVLVVTLDALRADATPGFGGDPRLAPNLMRWVQAGTRFERAYTTAPLTMPAHSSLFSGLYPMHHGARRHGVGAHMAELLPLVGAARAAGYTTAAFVSTRLLVPGRGTLVEFDSVDAPNDKVERTAQRTVGRAKGWLSHQPPTTPIFLWVHLFDVHSPYTPSKVRWQRCPERERAEVTAWARQATAGCTDPAGAHPWPDEEQAACVRELYESQLRDLDGPLGDLARLVAARGNFRWVLAGDHGECLGEEGHVAQHGGTLLECAVRIPLAIGGSPAFKAGATRDDLASLVDVAPTVAAMMGWSLPPVDGRDLASTVRGPDDGISFEAAGMDVWGCPAPSVGAWRGDEKVLYAPDTRTTRAWRRAGAGVTEIEPASLSPGGRRLAHELALEPPFPPPPGDLSPPKTNDPATETLRALGYVE